MRWDYQDLRVGFVLTWYSGVSMRRMLRGVANIITDLEALKGVFPAANFARSPFLLYWCGM